MLQNKQSLVFLIVLACFTGLAIQYYQNRGLPQPTIDINTGQASYDGLTIVSFDGPLANMGELVVTLNPGQVAKISVLFERAGEVVVTTDPALKKGLTMDFVDPFARTYLSAEASPGGSFLFTKEEYGIVHVYVAAKGLGETRFSVRHNDIGTQQQTIPIQP